METLTGTSKRLAIRTLLQPWKKAVSLSSVAHTHAGPAISGYCIAEHGERRELEAVALFKLALRAYPQVVADLASVDWFRSYEQPTDTNIRASTDVYGDVAVLVPFFGHQSLEDGPFLEAVRALKALGPVTDNTVVIPIAVRIHDLCKLTASDYSDHLPRLLLTSPSMGAAAAEVRFEATSIRVSLSAMELSTEVVKAMTKLARDSPTITFTDVTIDPFLVSCSRSQLDTFIASAAPTTASITVDIDKDSQYRVADAMKAVPMVCRALRHSTHFSTIALGALLSASQSHRAWQAVLDSIVGLLVRSDTATTVSTLSIELESELLSKDHEFLSDWVAAKPANRLLLSSSMITTLRVNKHGLGVLRDLLPTLDSIQCDHFVKEGDWSVCCFYLMSLAPSKFASVRTVTIDSASIYAYEMDAIASLPRLEELDLTNVSVAGGALLQFVASLVTPSSAARRKRWQRGCFKRLSIMQSRDSDSRSGPGVANEGLGRVLLNVLRTNRYLASITIVDQDAYLDVWSEVQAHDDEVLIIHTGARALCAFLSVLQAPGSRLASGGNLDAFTVRRIFDFTHQQTVRQVRVATRVCRAEDE